MKSETFKPLPKRMMRCPFDENNTVVSLKRQRDLDLSIKLTCVALLPLSRILHCIVK